MAVCIVWQRLPTSLRFIEAVLGKSKAEYYQNKNTKKTLSRDIRLDILKEELPVVDLSSGTSIHTVKLF